MYELYYLVDRVELGGKEAVRPPTYRKYYC